MEGDIPIKIGLRSSDKYSLPVSPLDVCLGYFANSCLKCTEHPVNVDTDIEALSFVLTTLLDEYDSIYCLEFHQLFRMIQEQFYDFVDRTGGQHEVACKQLIDEFQEWITSAPEHMCSLMFDLFDSLDKAIPKQEDSLSRDFGPESISVIRSFARRILVGYHSMSFEQVDILLTELRIYVAQTHADEMGGNVDGMGGYRLCKGAATIENILEKEISSMRAGIRNKSGLVDTLEKQCDALEVVSESGYSKSVLHARTAVALEKKNESYSIDSMYTFSDAPESSLTRRVLVKEEERDETYRGTIIEAALNVAMVQARLGRMKEAMKMVREHMRVSQQSSDGEFLAYSLAALCYILSRAVPGSLELQTGTVPSTTSAERHYLELHELLKKLFTRAEQGNLPEIALFAHLSLVEMALLHPKKQRDSSLGTFDYTHHKGAQVKTVEYSSPGFPRIQKPCVAAKNSLDACLYTKDLAYELALLSAGGPSKANSTLFLAPRAAGTLPFSQSDSRKKLEAMQACQTAEQIRSAGWLVWGSTRLSLSSALRVLHSSHKNDESEVSSLSLILINLYEQFGVDVIDRLSNNKKLQALLKDSVPLQRSWDIIQQRKAVHARQSRLAIKLAARVHIHPKSHEVTHIENTVECRELTALAYLSGGYYEDADKAALSGYTLARNACMSTYALRLLLLRGRIHIEAGSWETATPYICSVLEQYREISADLIGAEASMYMARIWSLMGSQYIERAMEEMDACMYIILAHANLETKGIARLTLARLLIQQDGGFSSLSPPHFKKVLRLLRDAESDFSKIRDWKLKAYVLHMASIMYDHTGDLESRDTCARACIQLRDTMEASGSQIYIHV